MSKIVELNMENTEELCDVGKALSSPVRLEILKLLYRESMIIGEIAKKLDIPPSSAALHLKILDKANLVRIEEQPGTRGLMKLCSRKRDYVNIRLVSTDNNIREVASVEMPIGAYTDCSIVPTCGLADKKGPIGMEDTAYSFYLPEKSGAQIIWSAGGYMEYRFANAVPSGCKPIRASLSMEICSEAPGYMESWKSDITVWINGIDCGTWTSPGDFGSRRGRLNPPNWMLGNTQFGLLMTWSINEKGTFINELASGKNTIDDLNIMEKPFVTIRIGNKENAEYLGGFNLFGKEFGDFAQSIVLNMEY